MPKDSWRSSSSSYLRAVKRGRKDHQLTKLDKLARKAKRPKRARTKKAPVDWESAQPCISLEVLKAMHTEVLLIDRRRRTNESEWLLCAIGSCMGAWPRVRRTKADQVKRRYQSFTGMPGR